MAKARFQPKLIFVGSDAAAAELAGTIKGSRIIDSTTGPLEFRKAMVEHANGDFETLIATPRWATGWRAPLGTQVAFTESFPTDLVEQASARVPSKNFRQLLS